MYLILDVILVVVGGGCLLAAVVVVLARLGFPRPAVAPTVAAVVGLVLIAIGIFYWPTVHPRHITANTTATPSPPAAAPQATSPAGDPSCIGFTPGTVSPSSAPSHDNGGLPETGVFDVQRLPSELTPGAPAGGVLVRAGANPSGFDVSTDAVIAPTMTDLISADYDDLSLSDMGGMAFLRVAVGTPRAGTCWNLLDAAALSAFGGGGHVANMRTERPGARMSDYHLTLLCGESAEVLNMCAWSGPGMDGQHPAFGILQVIPLATLSFTDGEMTAFVEKTFEAMTPA